MASSVQTPLQTFTQANLKTWIRSDLGVTVATGISSWLDQSGNANDFSQGTGSFQGTYTASDATLNNRPTLTMDGVDDFLSNTTISLPNPSVTPTTVYMVARQITWTINEILGCANNAASTCAVAQLTSTPQLGGFSGSTPALVSLALGTWALIECQFTGSTADLIRAASSSATGVSAGTNNGTGWRIARQGGGSAGYGNMAIAELFIVTGIPTAPQETAVNAYISSIYGAGLT